MSTTTHLSPPVPKAAARRNAPVDDHDAKEYRRGRGDGITWACDIATADELRQLVEQSEPGRDYSDVPYWRGFAAGAEEVLDAIGPLLTDAMADDRDGGEYRRGFREGIIWACDYATADELRQLVVQPGPGGGYSDVPYWRGFAAGAEEVLDAVRPLLNG